MKVTNYQDTDSKNIDTQVMRDFFLKETWKTEAKYLQVMRKKLELSLSDVSEVLSVDLADIKKLEKGDDFYNRDLLASFIKKYYETQNDLAPVASFYYFGGKRFTRENNSEDWILN
jgi:hypothetical protein